MKPIFEIFNRALETLGEAVSGPYLAIMSLVILVGIPALWIVGLIYLGAMAGASIGGGVLGILIFFSIPFFVCLFFSIYVWQIHVWPSVKRALDALK